MSVETAIRMLNTAEDYIRGGVASKEYIINTIREAGVEMIKELSCKKDYDHLIMALKAMLPGEDEKSNDTDDGDREARRPIWLRPVKEEAPVLDSPVETLDSENPAGKEKTEEEEDGTAAEEAVREKMEGGEDRNYVLKLSTCRTFAELLETVRIVFRLRNHDMAKRMEVNPMTLSGWRMYNSLPLKRTRPHVIRMLKDCFGVPVEITKTLLQG